MEINKNLIRVSGIYKIENIETKECYIGSTLNIYNRAHSYKCLGKQNKIHSTNLQKAINNYGIDIFTLEVLEKVYFEEGVLKSEKLKILHDKEQIYSDNTNLKYNKRKNINKNTGITLSKETKEKVSTTLKRIFKDGTRIIGRIYSHNIKVSMFTITGTFIKDFPGLAHCAEYLNVSPSSINYALKSKRHVIKNHIILKLQDKDEIKNFINIPLNKNTNGKAIKILDTLDDSILEFINCKTCANIIKCKVDTIVIGYKKNRLIKKRYKVITYGRY